MVVGGLLMLTGGGLISAGGVAVWADQTHRDADGYLTTDARTFRDDGYAMEFGTVDLRSADGTRTCSDPSGSTPALTPVYVNIASEQDVATYLGSVNRTLD